VKRAVKLYYGQIGPIKSARLDTLQNKATFQFWSQAERDIVPAVGRRSKAPIHFPTQRLGDVGLGPIVNQAARWLRDACPHETGRQLQAFVKGLAILFPQLPQPLE